jgi:hypothetical protein
VGVCVVITCLYASAFAAWALLGNEKKGVSEHPTQDPGRLRDNALYFAVGMAVVTVTLVLAIHDTDRGIQRTWRNDWFVGVGGAIFAIGYAAKACWTLRSDWCLWALLTALFAILVPRPFLHCLRWKRCLCCWPGRSRIWSNRVADRQPEHNKRSHRAAPLPLTHSPLPFPFAIPPIHPKFPAEVCTYG